MPQQKGLNRRLKEREARQDCNINVITLFSKLTKFCVHNVNTTGGMSEDDHLSLNVRHT